MSHVQALASRRTSGPARASQPCRRARLHQSAEALLRELAFVYHLTDEVRRSLDEVTRQPACDGGTASAEV